MAEMEAVCARLCLLTRAAWKEGLPSPLTRPMVCRMARLGALSGLALRRLPQIRDVLYERAEALLSRSTEVYAAVETCREQGYDVLLPEDEDWPVNLHALGAQMPQFLFVKGNREMLKRRSVAVAGSREIEENTVRLARACGKSLASEGYTMVCGGAPGVDMAAQSGFLDTGGSLILVPAFTAQKLLSQAYLSKALAEGRLLLVCDTWPDETFSPSKALTRNHAIYALGDAALVIAAREKQGGTWSGASACLRGGYTPVFALQADGTDFAGNKLLLKNGAKPFHVSWPLGEQLFETREDRKCGS